MLQNIVEWNCWGLLKNLDDIYEILSEHKRDVFVFRKHSWTQITHTLRHSTESLERMEMAALIPLEVLP